MKEIELIGVRKTYPSGDMPALHEFSLTIEEGVIMTLLGPSGCGKTTTLRLIAGFERPDQGIIKIDGKVMSDSHTWVPPDKRGIGMVFQDFALFPHLTVFNNVGFGYKGKDRRNRVREVLDLVDLKGLDKRYPHELSGGQQQRVALARAMAKRPDVILLDEPFSSLDADLRQQMRSEIRRIIKESGVTAVFVSHDQRDALTISDQVVVMKDGWIQQVGPPVDIYQNPDNQFVATFIGQTNILQGEMIDVPGLVQTPLGLIACQGYLVHQTGKKVLVSLRPECLVLDKNGTIKGTLIDYVYTGDALDGQIDLEGFDEKPVRMLVHLHAEEELHRGDQLSFRLLTGFASVIKKNEDEN